MLINRWSHWLRRFVVLQSPICKVPNPLTTPYFPTATIVETKLSMHVTMAAEAQSRTPALKPWHFLETVSSREQSFFPNAPSREEDWRALFHQLCVVHALSRDGLPAVVERLMDSASSIALAWAMLNPVFVCRQRKFIDRLTALTHSSKFHAGEVWWRVGLILFGSIGSITRRLLWCSNIVPTNKAIWGLEWELRNL